MDSELLKSLDPRQLGERLKDARKARGLTQENVAAKLGVLRTTLVAIEKGERRVSPGELIEMAKMYGRRVSDCVTKRANTEPIVPQFRLASEHQSVAKPDLIAAATELESLARDYLELEEINDSVRKPNFPPIYAFDVPGVTPDQRGEEVAAEERTRLGLGDGPIADLRSLLDEVVGVRLFYMDLPGNVGGLFACNDELGACIAINRTFPPARGNWFLAHEFGHFLTTRYLVDVSFTHDHWGKHAAEKFADSFAKHFLMPRTGVTRRLSDMAQAHGKGVTMGDVMSLAHLYGVSAEAMFRRLEELKRAPFGTWDKIVETRGFKPDQARAARGLQVGPRPPMLPFRYRVLAQCAFDHRERLTEGQLSRKLRTDRVSARLELESLRLLADDSGSSSTGEFAPVELDASELLAS